MTHREGVETVEEFNLCTAQRDLRDRDLGLIFMRRPGPHSPLFPVALDQPACQSEARRRRKRVTCQNEESWLEERGRKELTHITLRLLQQKIDPLSHSSLALNSLINYQFC